MCNFVSFPFQVDGPRLSRLIYTTAPMYYYYFLSRCHVLLIIICMNRFTSLFFSPPSPPTFRPLPCSLKQCMKG